jgi:hypothetical protein
VREFTTARDFQTLFDLMNQVNLGGALATVASTFIGAFFAFKFHELAVKRRKNLEESIALNRATAIVASHINAVGNYRRQIAQPKLEELKELTAICEGFEMKKREGENLSNLKVQPKYLFHTSQPITFLVGHITSNLAALSSLAGRPLAMAAELERSTSVLNTLIEDQNRIISDLWRDRKSDDVVFRLLGLVMNDGTVDSRFSHLVEQIEKISLDILYFGNAIIRDLVDHHLEWRTRNGGPPNSIIKYTATKKLRNELEAVEIRQEWDNYSIVKRYVI